MRLGIELSAAACRLVEIDKDRVRSFAVLAPAGPDTDAMLASLKGRDAAVVVWGTPSDHRQVVVTGGSYEAMRREAKAALASVGVNTSGVLADIAPVAGATGKRRPVVVALAAADQLLDMIRPVLSAGIRVRSVATPAMALAALAHTRRETNPTDGIEAYIVVEEATSCIALLRDGALAIARELPWGYVVKGALRARDDLTERLALELEQYLDAVGAPHATQVCVCGGVPDLRTMSAQLTARLDVEVEPLDSLFGIDEERLPEPSDDFRERIAELRLAWAAAADWPPHLNLLRARRRAQSRRILSAAAVIAGVAAGVGGAWRIARTRDLWPAPQPATKSVAVSRPAAPARGGTESGPSRVRPGSVPGPSPPTAKPAAPPPPPAVPPPLPLPPPLLASRSILPRRSAVLSLVRAPQPLLTPALVAELQPKVGTESGPSRVRPGSVPGPSPPPSVASATRPSSPPPSTKPPEPAASPRPIPPPPAVIAKRTSPPQTPVQQAPVERAVPAVPAPPPVLQRQTSSPPAAGTESTPSQVRPGSVPRPSQVRPGSVPTPVPESVLPSEAPLTRAPKPAPRAAKHEPVLPFDASLETILYSADRQLAIIDGRIVGVGDLVKGARIVEITASAVMLRDAQGRLHRLALGAGAK